MVRKVLMTTALAIGVIGTPACAKDITIEMKNVGSTGAMVFEPAFAQANVGDTVHFVPTDKGHNAEPIPGMFPDGISTAGGAINKEYVLVVSKPGLYGIKCLPHFSMGMIALIKAGKGTMPNASAIAAKAKSLPPLAQKRMAPLLAAAK